MAMNKLQSQLASLDTALDELETKLEPLLAQTLPESVIGLETVQQAKLQVALPYLVYDLIFIYLKTRGIDPKTHPVVAELDRIRQYFDKIKNAEDPAKRTATVDKAAANRFIKHAIAQVKAQRPPGDDEGPAHIRFSEGGDTHVPIKVTSKMAARAQYEKELAELGSEEEEDLEVIEDVGDAADAEAESSTSRNDKGKGKAADSDEAVQAVSARKRRRPPVDPFAGYGDEPSDESPNVQSVKKSKARTTAIDVTMIDTAQQSSGRSTPQSSSETAKKEKKAAKKAARKAKRRESDG